MSSAGPSGGKLAPSVAPADASEAGDGVPVLELVGIEKSFGKVQALRGAHLSARAGEIVGLCGDNGAGKSTLVKILAGVYAHGSYKGELRLEGRPQKLTCPADTQRAGIAVVHQHSMLVPQLSVAHNLMLGHEPRRFGLVDEARLQSQARALLARFGFAAEIDPALPVGELPTGLQQIVEIIRALARDARVLVLDQPSAKLLPPERDRLFAWLRSLKPLGTACIYVAHRMDELIGLCDQITVLRDGATAQTLSGSPAPRRGMAGRYLVHDEIASGGMATVHLGKIRGPFGFTSTVAIKRLHPLLAKDPEFVAMFLDEARLASRVRHPNVVPVLDVVAEEGDLSIVMEYVEGESLARLVRLGDGGSEATVPVPIAVAIVASILNGLHAAHEARDEQGVSLGLVHRDVSPQNVLVGTDGVPRLIDFGVAKAAGRSTASRNGQLKGKIAYIAPEQLTGGEVNRRTDVYGASVLLWELLTGERLFDGETEGMVIGRVLDDVVPPPSSLRDLPAALDAITLRGLERVPARRFESARAMARELEACVRPASADEVGEWVASVARAAIEERREKLSRLEREVSAPAPDPAPAAPRGLIAAAAESSNPLARIFARWMRA